MNKFSNCPSIKRFRFSVFFRSVFENDDPLKIDTSYGADNGTFIIKLVTEPTNKAIRVDLTFVSQLTSTLQGFYRVGYDDIDSNEKK